MNAKVVVGVLTCVALAVCVACTSGGGARSSAGGSVSPSAVVSVAETSGPATSPSTDPSSATGTGESGPSRESGDDERAGPAGSRAPRVIPTGLPDALRAAAFDPTSRSVLVLSRNTDPDEVLFTRIGADDDTVATITLPANGDDWQAGAVAASGGEAWVTWGDHLFDVTIATEAVHPVSVPWTHAVGASNGRSAGLAVADGTVWLGVIGETQLRGYDIATRTWRTQDVPEAVDQLTTLVAVGSTVVANLGHPTEAPTIPPMRGGLALVGSNDFLAANGTALAVAGDTAAALAGYPTVAMSVPQYGHAYTIPTGFDGRSLFRATDAVGRFTLAQTDLTTGATAKQSVTMPTYLLPVHGPVAPTATTPIITSDATKVESVVCDKGYGCWVVTEIGHQAPPNWGAVVFFPAP